MDERLLYVGECVSGKPNIVYIMTDQQKATAASFLGNTHVPSPFMDEMAASALSLRTPMHLALSAHRPAPRCSPVCTPSCTR